MLWNWSHLFWMLWCKNQAQAEFVSLLLAPFPQAQPLSSSRTNITSHSPSTAAPSAHSTTLQTTCTTYRIINHSVLPPVITKPLWFYTIKHLTQQSPSVLCINRSISSLLLLSPALPSRQKWEFLHSQQQPQAAQLPPDRNTKGSALGSDGEATKAAGHLCQHPRAVQAEDPAKHRGWMQSSSLTCGSHSPAPLLSQALVHSAECKVLLTLLQPRGRIRAGRSKALRVFPKQQGRGWGRWWGQGLRPFRTETWCKNELLLIHKFQQLIKKFIIWGWRERSMNQNKQTQHWREQVQELPLPITHSNVHRNFI